MTTNNIKITSRRLCLLVVFMFGFGFALVPLYDVFCDITGLNGKTGTLGIKEASSLKVDSDRIVTVEFDTNVNESLPLGFNAKDYKLRVHPGEVAEAVFIVKNKTDRSIVGQAIPSVAPSQASLFFNKTECFCFTQQTLLANEEREMKVRFVVDSKLPVAIETLTLSYTFFLVPGKNDVAKVLGGP